MWASSWGSQPPSVVSTATMISSRSRASRTGARVHVAEGEVDDPVAEHAHPREEVRAARLVAELREAREAACSAVVRRAGLRRLA